MNIEYLAQFHQRLTVTTTLVIICSLLLHAYSWWRKKPAGIAHIAVTRIIVLLLVSNVCIGGFVAMHRPHISLLHIIYAVVVFLPFIGFRFLSRYTAPTMYAKHMVVALIIILVVVHRLTVTASH